MVPDFQVERWPESTRIDLPRRPIGKLRYFGLIPMIFGGVFAWMPVSQIAHALVRVMEGRSASSDLLLSLFFGLFLMAGVIPFAFGLFVLVGRTRIIVMPERIRIIELAGLVRWSRRIRTANIERLALRKGREGVGGPSPLAKLGGLCAVMRDGKTLQVALGYPADLLERVAGEIISQTNIKGAKIGFAEEEVELRPDRQPAGKHPEQRERPAGSNVLLNGGGAGLEFVVPSRGLNKESYNLVGVGLVWCVVVGTIGAMILSSQSHSRTSSGSMFGLVMVSGFFCLGTLILLTGIHLGMRRWTLKVNGRDLSVEVRSPIRQKAWHWGGPDLKEIVVGDSGTKINDQPLLQIQVVEKNGRKTGLMTGREPDELEWLAWNLNQSLGLSPALEDPVFNMKLKG